VGKENQAEREGDSLGGFGENPSQKEIEENERTEKSLTYEGGEIRYEIRRLGFGTSANRDHQSDRHPSEPSWESPKGTDCINAGRKGVVETGIPTILRESIVTPTT